MGVVLRRWSLDELPQLFNVLKGEQSLVGPRPHAVEHNEYYRKHLPGYMQRHSFKPGITGLAQVEGWRGETADMEAMERRVDADLRYQRNWSLKLDIKILIKPSLISVRLTRIEGVLYQHHPYLKSIVGSIYDPLLELLFGLPSRL